MNPVAICMALSVAALAMHWHLSTARGVAGVRRYVESELNMADPVIKDSADEAVRECAANGRGYCLFLAAYCALMAYGLQHYRGCPWPCSA